MCVAISSFTSLYSLISLVRPLSSISPNGLLVSGHLENIKSPNQTKITTTQKFKMAKSTKGKNALCLHHADVMDKLQGERQQFVVGIGSKQTVIDNLWKR